MKTVLAIDPGGTTGLAWSSLKSPEENIKMMEIAVKSSSKFWDDPLTGVVMKVLAKIKEVNARVIVIEDNTALVVSPGMRGKLKKSSLIPVRFEAMLKFALEEKWYDHIWVRQSPSDKSVMTNARLKDLGVYQVGAPHANDAIRHLIIWSRRNEKGGK